MNPQQNSGGMNMPPPPPYIPSSSVVYNPYSSLGLPLSGPASVLSEPSLCTGNAVQSCVGFTPNTNIRNYSSSIATCTGSPQLCTPSRSIALAETRENIDLSFVHVDRPCRINQTKVNGQCVDNPPPP